MPEPILALEAVTLLSPEGRPVFRALDWRLGRGARFHAHGGAGGGGTALLRLCAGIAEPDSGRIVLDGTPLDGDTLHPFLARGALGWVPSDGGLAVNLSLLDNVALPLRFTLGQGRRDAERTALAWLEKAGLGQVVHERPVPGHRECWMASLARAAAKGSRLWLVDRPLGGLDAASIQAAEELLGEVARDPGVTLLLVGGAWMASLGQELKIGNGRVFSGVEP
jgi:putative ABC transport system ATP-binding protein